MPDLNTVALSGTLTKMPDFAQPWTFCELKVLRGETSVLFIALHVRTDDHLHQLEDLSPGDRIHAIGELAYTKAAGLATGGQICVKVKDLRRLDPAGRLEEPLQPCAEVADQVTPSAPVGSRHKRHRKRRRARPEGQHR